MVLIGAFNALARWATRFTGFSLASNAYLDLQWNLFALVFLLGAAHGLPEGAHVRVDVLYGRLSRRGRAWIDLLGTLLFLIPFSVAMLVVSWPAVRASWAVREGSPDPGGLPRYPIKAVILLAFAMLAAAGVAYAYRQVRVLAGAGAEDE
ncbi:MAG: TRAP transporter small permease subunit, partial [Gemmatimonadetes bacterium]